MQNLLILVWRLTKTRLNSQSVEENISRFKSQTWHGFKNSWRFWTYESTQNNGQIILHRYIKGGTLHVYRQDFWLVTLLDSALHQLITKTEESVV